MLFYHYKLFLIFIVLAIVNFILLSKKIKSKKLTLIVNSIIILINIFMIIMINTDFLNLISKEYANNTETLNKYYGIIYNFNITFLITSFIVTTILLILSKKIKYNTLYIITIVSLIIGSILLFCFKGFIITKDTINFGMLAQCLSFYYMYLCQIPLLTTKFKGNK